MIEKEYEYFKGHKTELIQKYRDRYVVIVDEHVESDHADYDSAIKDALTKHQPGTFIVQQCSDAGDTIARFYSRVRVEQHVG